MYKIEQSQKVTIGFRNGYSIQFNIGHNAFNHNGKQKQSGNVQQQSVNLVELSCPTSEVSILYHGEDVTGQMIESGILKRNGFVPADIFIKVANIIRKLDMKDYSDVQKIFELHWSDGKMEDVPGDTIADVFTNAGFGAGALSVLDYYVEKIDTDTALKIYMDFFESKITKNLYEKIVPFYSRIKKYDPDRKRITFIDGRKIYLDGVEALFLDPVEEVKRKVESLSDHNLRIAIKELDKRDPDGMYDIENNITMDTYVEFLGAEIKERDLYLIP